MKVGLAMWAVAVILFFGMYLLAVANDRYYGLVALPIFALVAIGTFLLLGAGIRALASRSSENANAVAQHATAGTPAPGWYPDPNDSKWLAYWDGVQWAEGEEKRPNR